MAIPLVVLIDVVSFDDDDDGCNRALHFADALYKFEHHGWLDDNFVVVGVVLLDDELVCCWMAVSGINAYDDSKVL